MKSILSIAVVLVASAVISFLPPLQAQAQRDAILTVHVVQRGENLFRIALQYDLFADQVARANGLSDTDSIAVGQRLIIPLLGDSPQPAISHTVSAGDTLESIAEFYGESAETLIAINGLASAADLALGQELIVVTAADEGNPIANQEGSDLDEGRAVLLEESVEVLSANETSLVLGDSDFTYVHVVEAGDTVYDIGLRFNQTVNSLAALNNLQDPTSISIGQRLVIPGIEPPRLMGQLPETVVSLALDPLILVEGGTGRIEIHTREPATVSGEFLDQELRVIEREPGMIHTILVGIPMFTGQDVFPLRLSILSEAGEEQAVEAALQVIAGGYGYQNITIDNSELLAPAVEDEETNLLARVTRPFTLEKRWNQSLGLPAAASMNAVYGTLRSYNGSPYNRYHSGVDFAGATGTSVLAAADGQVVLADTLHIRGNTIVIDHGWGLYTLYAHQNSMLVSVGEIVTLGQTIGTIGSTGRSTGPHLHWEVWLHGVNVDPMQWVRQKFP